MLFCTRQQLWVAAAFSPGSGICNDSNGRLQRLSALEKQRFQARVPFLDGNLKCQQWRHLWCVLCVGWNSSCPVCDKAFFLVALLSLCGVQVQTYSFSLDEQGRKIPFPFVWETSTQRCSWRAGRPAAHCSLPLAFLLFTKSTSCYRALCPTHGETRQEQRGTNFVVWVVCFEYPEFCWPSQWQNWFGFIGVHWIRKSGIVLERRNSRYLKGKTHYLRLMFSWKL